ncbi:MAG: hypothetical protein IJY14_01605 [Acholeplasmatales bacterium]|nr:hypothetical protein [Acholeplasmatales bacterium]
MNKSLKYISISILLLIPLIGCITSVFFTDDTYSLFIALIFGIILFVGFLVSMLYTLSYFFGKTCLATITKKKYHPRSYGSTRRGYTIYYAIGKIKGSFELFELDDDVSITLDVGDKIEVKKLLFATTVDTKNVVHQTREEHENDPQYQKTAKKVQERNSRMIKMDLIVIGIVVAVFIIIMLITYLK